MCAKPLEPEISNGQLRCPHVTHFSDSDTVNGNEWNLSSSRFLQKNQKKHSKDSALHGEGGRMQPRYADHGHVSSNFCDSLSPHSDCSVYLSRCEPEGLALCNTACPMPREGMNLNPCAQMHDGTHSATVNMRLALQTPTTLKLHCLPLDTSSASICMRLEALAVNDGRARLIIFALGDPHLLESAQRRQNRTTNPHTVLALRRSNHLDLHGGRCQSSELLGHSLTNALEHGGST